MIDFSKNSYLTTLNLINKYKLKSVLEKPKLESIIFTINLKQKYVNNFEIVKIYIIFYLSFNNKPFFSVKSFTSVNNNVKTKKDNQSYKIVNISLKTFFLKEQFIHEALNNFPTDLQKRYFRFKNRLVTTSSKRCDKQINFVFESKISLARWIDCFMYQKLFNIISIELKDLLINVKLNFSTRLKSVFNIKYLAFNILSSWKILGKQNFKYSVKKQLSLLK